jgi:hypothetical protein
LACIRRDKVRGPRGAPQPIAPGDDPRDPGYALVEVPPELPEAR